MADSYADQLSFNDRQSALRPMCDAKLGVKPAKDGMCGPGGSYIKDLFDACVIVEYKDKLHRFEYAMAGGKPKLTSGPEEVMARTEYEPVKGAPPAGDAEKPMTVEQLRKTAKLKPTRPRMPLNGKRTRRSY